MSKEERKIRECIEILTRYEQEIKEDDYYDGDDFYSGYANGLSVAIAVIIRILKIDKKTLDIY